MDDAVENLLQYAAKQGVKLHGITPQRLPGRGYGIVASRAIKKGELVLEVPTRALRTLATVPKVMSRKLSGEVSVHGILAADLMLDSMATTSAVEMSCAYAPWNAVLPTPADLESGMPLLWPATLQALLPSAAAEALGRQRAKLQRDWSGLQTAIAAATTKMTAHGTDDDKVFSRLGRATLNEYRHAWLLVNSRTFYYTTIHTEAALSRRDDRIAMQPVADLFNHAADRGCRAAFSASGFAFVADRSYHRGDEVPISYGAHGNDALLVEYGFVLDPVPERNRWDEVALDAVVLPQLTSRAMRDDLATADFLGGYMVDAATPGGCYRTHIALRRVLCGSDMRRLAAWLRFVEGGGSDGDGGNGGGDGDQVAVDALVLTCLDAMADLARSRLAEIRRLDGNGDSGEVGENGEYDDEYDDQNARDDDDEAKPAKKARLAMYSIKSERRCEMTSQAQRYLLALRWRQIKSTVERAAEQLRAASK